MERWEKLRILSGSAAAIVIPIALAYIGNAYSSAIKERELQGRFVELAVDILREEPDEEEDALRKWAADVIDEYSGVSLSADARTELVSQKSLPGPTQSSGPWIIVMGADQTLESAQHELTQARNRGFASSMILLRDGWYRTVVSFSTRAEALAALEEITALRPGSYVRQLDTWCPQPEPSSDGGYEVCQ